MTIRHGVATYVSPEDIMKRVRAAGGDHAILREAGVPGGGVRGRPRRTPAGAGELPRKRRGGRPLAPCRSKAAKDRHRKRREDCDACGVYHASRARQAQLEQEAA